MMSGQRRDQILQDIQESRLDLSDSTTRAGVRSIASRLAEMTYDTMSDCGLVTVVHNGAGALADIRVADDAFRRYDAQRMAEVVTRTIQEGERTIREVLREAAYRTGEGG